MKATETKLLQFLRKSPQFRIPIYQRAYSWTQSHCQQLWNDILRAGEDDAISGHFIGPVVYIAKDMSQNITSQSPLLVIDGQQRLTTVSLLLEALARSVGDGEPIDGFSAKKLRSYYLLNMLEEEENEYKILLTRADKNTFLALLKQRGWPENHSLRLRENFEFFEQEIKKLGSDLGILCQGIAKLLIVDIELTRNQDNPQLIFESMNSTGKALSQADLIRNFILMELDIEHQTRLYEEYWHPMEVAFGQQAYSSEFDGFMRHYLTVKTGEIPRIDDVYEEFKKLSKNKDMDALVADIRDFAFYFCAMALDKEQNKILSPAFKNLRELKVDVAFPFLLGLYHDYDHGILSVDDFAEAVCLVESYVFRRAICGIPANSMNKTFVAFSKYLNKEKYLESIQAYFLNLTSYRRFPRNENFQQEIQQRDLYNFRSRSYWLRRMENFSRREQANVNEYTIEHILPQNLNLPEEWQNALGEDWRQIQNEWLHKLGNLTLTGYNARYSDKPFAEKRDMEGGFKNSPLILNTGLGQVEQWNVQAIQKRGAELASRATEVWPAPYLNDDILEQYRETVQKAPTYSYSMKNHEHFLGQGSPMRALFENLRNALLSMDKNVSEDILKRYIAFKAETNFVDVEPQRSQLRLSINMSFHDLNDPRKMAKDITNLGRWGNGDVEVGLAKSEDLPYVLGLIRQAFESQMGDKEPLL